MQSCYKGALALEGALLPASTSLSRLKHFSWASAHETASSNKFPAVPTSNSHDARQHFHQSRPEVMPEPPQPMILGSKCWFIFPTPVPKANTRQASKVGTKTYAKSRGPRYTIRLSKSCRAKPHLLQYKASICTATGFASSSSMTSVFGTSNKSSPGPLSSSGGT